MNIMTSSSSSIGAAASASVSSWLSRDAATATASAFASTTRSCRSRSSAARRATWYSHAVGLSGTPPTGQVCSALTSASWTASSASDRRCEPSWRVSTPTSRLDSRRNS